MSKKLQLAFSERRIRKGIYRMYARFRPYHLIGAIGGFLTALTAIISLAVSTSYYISAEWVIIVNMLLIPGASAVFILDVGKPDKRRWAGWPADLFLRPQYHLLDSFSHSGYFLVYRGCTVWLR